MGEVKRSNRENKTSFEVMNLEHVTCSDMDWELDPIIWRNSKVTSQPPTSDYVYTGEKDKGWQQAKSGLQIIPIDHL